MNVYPQAFCDNLTIYRNTEIQKYSNMENKREINNKLFCVYFIQAKETGRIKIGYAKDVNKRLKNLQTSSADQLDLLAYVKGGRNLEKLLHEKFASCRTRGEWFIAKPELLDFIQQKDLQQTVDKLLQRAENGEDRLEKYTLLLSLMLLNKQVSIFESQRQELKKQTQILEKQTQLLNNLREKPITVQLPNDLVLSLTKFLAPHPLENYFHLDKAAREGYYLPTSMLLPILSRKSIPKLDDHNRFSMMGFVFWKIGRVGNQYEWKVTKEQR